MQNSKKFLLFSLFLAICLGGCKKNQKKITDQQKPFFSKTHKQEEAPVEPFQLDQNTMKSFALDDKITPHQSTTSSRHTKKSADNPLLSWENVSAEDSKHQFKTLHFDFNVDTLKPTQKKALQHNVDQAKKMIQQGKTIVIEGHACHSEGSAIYNLALSERRARHVAQEFAKAGIDSSTIKIAPRGQEMPVRKGGNRQQQWVNRRSEIFAINPEQKSA